MAAGLVKREVCFSDQAAGHNTTMLLIAILGISLPTLMVNIGQFNIHDEPPNPNPSPSPSPSPSPNPNQELVFASTETSAPKSRLRPPPPPPDAASWLQPYREPERGC